jgi:copper(I)-binding protein
MIMRWMSLAIVLFTAALALAHVQLEVRDAYVPQPPPGQTMGVVFMTVRNRTSNALSLLGVRSDVASKCELHTHVHADGRMRMEAVRSVLLPAGRDTEFRPGGLHVMLFGLKRALRSGDQVPLTLELSDGTTLRAVANVRDTRR